MKDTRPKSAGVAELTCVRCGERAQVNPRMAEVLRRLKSSRPFVCSKCAVDGKGEFWYRHA